MIISGTAGGNNDQYYEGQKKVNLFKEDGFVSIKVDDNKINIRF